MTTHAGKEIKRARLSRGVSVIDASKQAGVSVSRWYKIEQSRNLTLDTLEMALAVLGFGVFVGESK